MLEETHVPLWHVEPTTQADWFCHVPVLSQVCGSVELAHCLAPGAHVPEQVPVPVHTYGHACVVCQAPVASHVCTEVPLHWVAPGVQLPVHVPAPVHR